MEVNLMKTQKAPTPFCYNLKKVKAIVLGADPSNFFDKGKRKILTKAYGIGDGDVRYFQGILKNLKEIGLGLEDIYVDNLIQDYLESETSKNEEWNAIAKENIPLCLERLDEIDKKRKLPILIIAEVIYKAISISKPTKASQFYSLADAIPVSPSDNKLMRPVIPFYRHQDYSLLIQKWNPYRQRIIEILESV